MITNPTIKGLQAEGRFIVFAAKHGWEICQPLAHDVAYDYLVNDGSGWIKVQVKTTYTSSKGYREVSFRRGRSNKRTSYLATDFDWMFVFDTDSRREWWIPMKELFGAKSCVIVSAKRWKGFENL